MLEEFDDHPDPADTAAPTRPRRRWGRRILALVLAVVGLGVVATAGYLGFLNHVVTDNVKHEDLLGTGAAPTTGPDGQVTTPPAVAAGRGENYLVIGSDARPGDAGRADVIILAHVTEDKKKVYLIHFPRDLYVDIPGRGKNKINASYAFGGAPLLVRTVQDLVGVTIDHVAKTDFTGFQKMTDAVGGVRVWAEEASNGTGNGGANVIKKGWNDLDGAQALGFVRERYALSEGDISRGKRQQAFIKALMLKTVSKQTLTNPITVARFLDAATSNLVVDNSLSVADMRAQAFSLRNIRSGDIIFITAPFTGFGTVAGVGSIDVVDPNGMQQLGDALANDTLADYKDTTTIP